MGRLSRLAKLNCMKNFIAIITVLIASVVANNAINSRQLNTDNCVTYEDLFNDFASLYGEKQSEAETNASDLLAFADRFQGTKYLLGANGPNRFDCSGFTSYVFRHFGYNLARRASHQINDGEKVSKGDVRPGDLVFFNGRSINGRIGHVGIIYDVNDNGTFTFIHASIHGVRHNNSTDNYYARRYMGACRILSADN